MRKDIIDKLMELTQEEKEILEGKHSIDQSIYTDDKQFIIDSKKILAVWTTHKYKKTYEVYRVPCT